MENNSLEKRSENIEKEFDLSSIASQEIINMFLPQLANFVPVIEKKVKEYIKEKGCIIIIKPEKNGDITATMIDKNNVMILPKKAVLSYQVQEGYSSNEMILKSEKGEKEVYSFDTLKQLLLDEKFLEKIKSL